MGKNFDDYTADDITALTPLEHLRKRLNLTFGDERGNEDYPFSSMKGVAVREIIDNSVSEVAIGAANYIRVTAYEDGHYKVEDNGRGVPTDMSEDAYGNSVNGIYKALGLLQSGSALKGVQKGKFVSSQNGLGASATNGVSKYFKVKVYRQKKIFSLDFKDNIVGKFEGDKFIEGSPDKIYKEKDNRPDEEKKLFPHGTSIEFLLDDQYFYNDYPVDYEDIRSRVRGSAFLFPKTTFEIVKETNGKFTSEKFYSENGIRDLANLESSDELSNTTLFKGKTAFIERGGKGTTKRGLKSEDILKEINSKYKNGDIMENERELEYEVAFNYNTGYDYKVDSYVNSVRTTLGGTHVKAIEKSLVDCFNEKFRSMRSGLSAKDSDVNLKDTQEGLVVIIDIKTNVPRFVGQEKQILGGEELQKALYDDFSVKLKKWLNSGANREQVELIANKVITAMKNRTRIQQAQELNRQKNKVVRDSVMPEKLLDCEITHSPISELYISEGDSAASGLGGCRDSRMQAVFPVRGKILNLLKASNQKILDNDVTKDLIKIISAGIGKDFDLDKMRYQKIIIACDADPDGHAIANLLITWLWVLMPEVIKAGRLYRMLTPLYRVKTTQGKHYYCVSQEEKLKLESELKERGEKIKHIDRYKGLGETNSEVLFETGMNPKTRKMIQLTVDDVAVAENMINIVSGDNVENRKKWITDNPYIPEIVTFEESAEKE